MSIPMKPPRMTSGCIPASAELTDPVVTAVVTTVQNADMKPPNLVSMSGPSCGIVALNAMARSIMKSR